MNKSTIHNYQIVMVGPDPEDMGGIARVVKNWQAEGLFAEYHITYISTTSDSSHSKVTLFLKQLFHFLKVCRGERTVVYIHTSSFKSFYRKCIFIVLSLLHNVPIVLHIHPSHFFTFLSRQSKFTHKFTISLLRRVTCFVVLTAGSLTSINQLFPHTPAFVLHNIVQSSLLGQHNVARLSGKALFLGWYVKKKGIYELVDAIEILLNRGYLVELECFGTKGERQLRTYVTLKNLEQRIKINGWADDKTKLDALLTSTMLILPSHTEGIPNVILEAWATRTPVVSTPVGGLAEILIDGYNAIVAEPENPYHLSLTIEKCLNQPELRKKIADNAYLTVLEEYSMPTIRRQFARIVTNAFKQSGVYKDT